MAVQKYPDSLENAIEYIVTAMPELSGARSVSEGPNFQPVEASSSGDGKQVVRFQEATSTPSNPPPSPRYDKQPSHSDPSTAVTVLSDKREVIDVNKYVGEDDDALQRAIDASLRDSGTDASMDHAIAESMRTATISRSTNEPLHAPAAKRRRLNAETPVILRPTTSSRDWLPPVLHSLYANVPFRDALLSLDMDHPSHPEGHSSGLTDFWNGRLVFPALASNDQRTKLDILAALQRLFAFMTYTARHAVSLADIEMACVLDQSSGSLDQASEIKQFYHSIQEGWAMAVDEALRKAISNGADVDQARDLAHTRIRTLTHCGGQVNPATLELTVEATEVALLDLNVVAQLPTDPLRNDLIRAFDNIFLAESKDGVPLILEPAQSVVCALNRPNFNANYADRRPFSFPEELYLDRYARSQWPLIREKRSRYTQMGEQRAGLAQRMAFLTDPKNQASIHGTLEYLEKVAKPKTEQDAQRQAFLKTRIEQARTLMENQIAEVERETAAIDKEASELFETADMRTVGPFAPVAAIFSHGLSSFHTYIIDHTHSRVFKATATDSFEVEGKDVINDTTGIYTGDGLVVITYARMPAEATPPSSEILAAFKSAIEADNAAFEAEQAADMDADLPPLLTEAVQPDPFPSGMLSGEVGDIPVPQYEDAEMAGDSQDVMRIRGGAASMDLDDESDEEGFADANVQLGFLSDMPRKGLDTTLMTGKVGGKPLWLDPTKPLPADAMRCQRCSKDTRFLLQLNAPDDENADAFYRMIYVFACESAACIKEDAATACVASLASLGLFANAHRIRVFRIQLREDADCLRDDVALSQSLQSAKLSKSDTTVYREYELVSEPEEHVDSAIEDVASAPRLDSADGPDASEPDTTVGVDAAFLRFQERLAAEPEQIMRYYFGDPMPDPLWISDVGKNVASKIPACPLCGHQRTCELQILPTLIASLGIEDETRPDSFDFGTLLIYTCSKHCSIPEQGWAEEVCFAQAASTEGVMIGKWR